METKKIEGLTEEKLFQRMEVIEPLGDRGSTTSTKEDLFMHPLWFWFAGEHSAILHQK